MEEKETRVTTTHTQTHSNTKRTDALPLAAQSRVNTHAFARRIAVVPRVTKLLVVHTFLLVDPRCARLARRWAYLGWMSDRALDGN